ncbi:MAG: hypothetical protein QXU67_04200 [Candidatus Bathyarchaeia archaeon]
MGEKTFLITNRKNRAQGEFYLARVVDETTATAGFFQYEREICLNFYKLP